jgi:8-oxo-dGTP pyrophosphatase MutT (NUDIX family)
MAGDPQLRQVAALPWRRTKAGIDVLLISSRETRRWVIPKGWAIDGLPDHGAAAREAFEEAGIEGIVAPHLLGFYDYDKRGRAGSTVRIRVDVYPLEVIRLLRSWPERSERDRRWFPAGVAAGAVNELDLAALIARLR